MEPAVDDEIEGAVLPLFLFVFVIIRFFCFRYTFYHVNDYGIKLCGGYSGNSACLNGSACDP